MKNRAIKDIYMTDILLHSNIKPNEWTINPHFEQFILDKITAITPTKGNIILKAIINKNLDIVIVSQNNETLHFYHLKNSIELTEKSVILQDTNDKYKQYYNIDISCLQPDLQKLIKVNNNNTNKDIITAHRALAGVLYNISGLEVHHIDYQRFNPDGKLERLKTTLDTNLLLPCSRDFHISILHSYINDCNTTADIKALTEVSLECKNELDKYVYKVNDSYKLGTETAVTTVIDILTDYYKSDFTINTLSKKYGYSRQTINDLTMTYKNFKNWL